MEKAVQERILEVIVNQEENKPPPSEILESVEQQEEARVRKPEPKEEKVYQEYESCESDHQNISLGRGTTRLELKQQL